MGCRQHVMLIAFACAIGLATAARVEQQFVQAHNSIAAEPSTKRLNTYYFDVSVPKVELSSRVSSRPERTAITVKLAEGTVSRFMPVVSPQAAGMTHAVSNTWQALKNLATMFVHVNTINKQHPSAERLFPRAALAVSGASDNAPVKLDMDAIINSAEAVGNRNAWAEVTPSSVLLLPAGQPTGAVADVLDVTYDDKSNTIALELDLVHKPQTISEFEPHDKQTLDVQEAHYHFATAPGVKVDAHALLSSLQSGSGFATQGMHVFMKGNIFPFFWCGTATLSAETTQAAVGARVQFTVAIAGQCDPVIGKEHGRASAGTNSTVKDTYTYAVSVVGPAQVTVDASRHTPNVKQGQSSTLLSTDGNGEGQFSVDINGPGCVVVYIVGVLPTLQFYPLDVPASVLINCEGGVSAPVSKVQLMPHKAYRHVHDSVTFSALALDAANKPVAGAKIAFSEYGDCDASIDQTVVTTLADGIAAVKLVADKPGVVSVVAAGVNTEGAPVLSEPSTIFFFTERHEADHREHEYYGEHSDGQHVQEDSDAHGYAKSAAQRAQQLVQKAA